MFPFLLLLLCVALAHVTITRASGTAGAALLGGAAAHALGKKVPGLSLVLDTLSRRPKVFKQKIEMTPAFTPSTRVLPRGTPTSSALLAPRDIATHEVLHTVNRTDKKKGKEKPQSLSERISSTLYKVVLPAL